MCYCEELPELEFCEDLNSWHEYQENIYKIFCDDFINGYPLFRGKQVKIRYAPIEHGKEEGFFHVTCQDYSKTKDRAPDFRRCERIRWVRWFIENYNCELKKCVKCSGVKIWDEPYKNTYRTHILLEEERYMVVLENRAGYTLLITAFYFDQDHALRKKLKKYNQYKQSKKRPITETPSGTPSTTGR